MNACMHVGIQRFLMLRGKGALWQPTLPPCMLSCDPPAPHVTPRTTTLRRQELELPGFQTPAPGHTEVPLRISADILGGRENGDYGRQKGELSLTPVSLNTLETPIYMQCKELGSVSDRDPVPIDFSTKGTLSDYKTEKSRDFRHGWIQELR